MNCLRAQGSHVSIHPIYRLVHVFAVTVTTGARLLDQEGEPQLKEVMENSHTGGGEEHSAEEIGRYRHSNLGSAL